MTAGDAEAPRFGSRARGVFEEALKAGRKDLLLASVIGLVLSAVGYVVLGGFFYLLLLYMFARGARGADPDPPLSFPVFFAIYTLVVVFLMALGAYYQPKDRYDFGMGGGRHGHVMDNPLTFRDDADRAHANLGFLLVIPNFIRLNLVTLKDFITSGGSGVDPSLAGGILVLAGRSVSPGGILRAHLGHGEKAVARAIDTLKVMRWIRVRGASVSITDKGTDVLRRAGM